MADSFIKVLENAIVSQLRDDISHTWVRENSIRTYQGEIDDFAERLVPDMPLVLIVYGGSTLEEETLNQTAGGTKWETTRWELYVMTQSLRGESGRRDPNGAYDLVDAVRASVDGKMLGIVGCDQTNVVSVDLEAVTKTPPVVIYSIVMLWPHLRDIAA